MGSLPLLPRPALQALDDCSTQALNTDPQARRVVVRPRMSVKVEVGLDTGPEAGTTTATAHVRMAELFSALEVLGLQESYLKRMTGGCVGAGTQGVWQLAAELGKRGCIGLVTRDQWLHTGVCYVHTAVRL